MLHDNKSSEKYCSLGLTAFWYAWGELVYLVMSRCELYQIRDFDTHDDAIKWTHIPRYWPFVRGIPGPGEFPAQRPVTRSFDVYFLYQPE